VGRYFQPLPCLRDLSCYYSRRLQGLISVVLEHLTDVVWIIDHCRLRSLHSSVEECFLACEKSRRVVAVSHCSHFLQSQDGFWDELALMHITHQNLEKPDDEVGVSNGNKKNTADHSRMGITSSSGIASDPLLVRISSIYPRFHPGMIGYAFGSLSKRFRFGASGKRLEIEVELCIGRGVGN
jgi:hypothetical protein